MLRSRCERGHTKPAAVRGTYLVLGILAATVGVATAQVYQPPKPFDVHEPRGNERLRAISYRVEAILLSDGVPLKATATVSVNNAGERPAEEINFYLHPELQVETVVDEGGNPLTFETRKVEFWPSTTLLATEVSVRLPSPPAGKDGGYHSGSRGLGQQLHRPRKQE